MFLKQNLLICVTTGDNTYEHYSMPKNMYFNTKVMRHAYDGHFLILNVLLYIWSNTVKPLYKMDTIERIEFVLYEKGVLGFQMLYQLVHK